MSRLVLGAKLVGLSVLVMAISAVMNLERIQLLPATFAVLSAILLFGAFVVFLLKFANGGVYAILGFAFVSAMTSFILSEDARVVALLVVLMAGCGTAVLHNGWITEAHFAWRLNVRSYRILMAGFAVALVLALAPWTWGSSEASALVIIYAAVAGAFLLTASALLMKYASKALGSEQNGGVRLLKWSIALFAFVAVLPAQIAFLRGDGTGLGLLIWAPIFVLFIDILLAPTLALVSMIVGVKSDQPVLSQVSNPAQRAFEGPPQSQELPRIPANMPQISPPILRPVSRDDLKSLVPTAIPAHDNGQRPLAAPSPSPTEASGIGEAVPEIAGAPTQAYAQPKLEEIKAYWESYQQSQSGGSKKQ